MIDKTLITTLQGLWVAFDHRFRDERRQGVEG